MLSLLIFFLTAEAQYYKPRCDLRNIIKIKNQELWLWDQEITGVDLIKNEKTVKSATSIVPIGIIESGMNLDVVPKKRRAKSIETNVIRKGNLIGDERIHGSQVASVIFNDKVGLGGPIKLAALAKRDCTFEKGWTEHDIDFYKDHYQGQPHRIKCDLAEAIEITEKAKAKVINLSGQLGSWKETERQLTKSHAILVTSAGNDPNSPEFPINSIKSRVPAIVVGTITLEGKREGSYGDIDILGPDSTPALKAKNNPGGYGSFGMTSGATALVTSVVAAALSFLPNLDLITLKKIMKDTSLKTSNDKNLINGYKMVLVARLIRDELQKTGKPLSAEAISAFYETNKNRMINFERESQDLVSKAKILLKAEDCKPHSEALTLLRKAYFLNQNEAVNQEMVSLFERDDSGSPLINFYKSLNRVRTNPSSTSGSR